MNLMRYVAAVALMCAPAAYAQYNPTINVEGRYKPEIILQDRVNTFPERVRMGALESRLEFDLDGVVTDFAPVGVPMPATGWNAGREEYPYRGYVGAAIGSWLDFRFNAGYRFVADRNTLAGVYLRHNSTSLWKPDLEKGVREYRRRMADQELGFYVRHLNPGSGMLDADLKYRVAYFNYYAYSSGTYAGDEKAPTQTLNNVDFHLLWQSKGERRFQYYAGADVRYNGFRSYYELMRSPLKGNRETMIVPRLGVQYGFGNASAIGLDLGGDVVLYSGGRKDGNATGPDNYGRLTLTPYYKNQGDNVYLYAGPRIDMIFNNGPFLRLAPDFRLGWHTRGIAMELTAGGGTELNTLYSDVEQSLYCFPAIYDAEPVYVPLEAGLKFAFGPFAGFRAEISGKFRRALGQHIDGGWYQPFLGAYGAMNEPGSAMYPVYRGTTLNMYGVQMGLRLSYEYGRYFGIEAAANYQPQEGKKGYFNGWDLPEATGHIKVRSNPWTTLNFGVDWNIRACRRPLLAYGNGMDYELRTVHMKNWSSLDFSASYDILTNLTVEFEVRNLTNRLHQEWIPGLPTPGITVHGGLMLQF